MRKFTVLELFAGAGGMALGFQMAGLGTEALIEIDKQACATLKKNRPDWNVIHQDVAEIDYTKFKADVVAGWFPCQAFSSAGKGLGFEDTRGNLFFEFARAVKEIKPKIFVAENVEGLKNHDEGRTLQTMIKVLTDLGYHLQMKVLNATDYSVAQKRKRIFLIGTLPGYHFTYPMPHKDKIVLRDALKDVPASKGTKFSQKRYDVMKLVPPGGCWVNLPIEIQKEFMGASFHSGGGKRGMARRISWDEACLTLTTSPSQKQTDICHPEETRPFTIREYARIQSFPDDWEFEGSVSSCYKQIGNAVAVNVAVDIGKQIIEVLRNPDPTKAVIETPFTQKIRPIQTELFPDKASFLESALKNGKLKPLKSHITEKTIREKLKKPVNLDSPISQTFSDEQEWLREKSKEYTKTKGGHYLQEIIVATALISGWENPVGKATDVINHETKQKVMLKTQGSTSNDSTKIGDKKKESESDFQKYDSHQVYFFAKNHAKSVKKLFGYSTNQIDEIRNFLIQEEIDTRHIYEQKMKEHELYQPALESIRQVINKYEHKLP